MEFTLLFPSKFRHLGYLLAVPGFILGYITLYKSELVSNFFNQYASYYWLESYANEVALTMVIIGMLFISFSKMKYEDELTGKVRIYALYWAILVNYAIYAALVLFIIISLVFNLKIGGGILGPYAYFLGFSEFNLFTPLFIFVLVFNYVLFRRRNEFVIRPMRYLPNRPYRFIGKWLSILMMAALAISTLLKSESEWLQVALFSLPLTLLMWAFSKEKNEDEFTQLIRMEAMQIAVYVNYGILLIANFSVYGIAFWTVQDIYLATIPLIFIVWFQYKLYRIDRQNEAKTLAS